MAAAASRHDDSKPALALAFVALYLLPQGLERIEIAIKNCRTPMLVLPDDVPGHPLQTSNDVASLAPNAEITVYPWKEPEDLKQRTIDRVRRFLKAHIPMRAAAQ